MCLLSHLLVFTLLLVSCAAPRADARVLRRARQHDLMEVRDLIPALSVELRYATRRNLAARALYPAGMPCLLKRVTAEKLRRAQQLLTAEGYALRIWDAWRPAEAQIILHARSPHAGLFTAPEAGWSRHCAGISVDVTLLDDAGRELSMPTGFDEDYHHASAHYTGGDPLIAKHLRILQAAMRRAGFLIHPAEWWHFDDADFSGESQPAIYSSDLALRLP
jgi:zinc D-Ala-D-Ala dipeptidase